MLVYILESERCFCMALLEIWSIVTCYVCLYCLFLFLGEILWLCYTFEGEFTYDVNNSVICLLGFSWTIMSLSTDVAKFFL